MNASNQKRYQIVIVFLLVIFSVPFFIATVKAANFCVTSSQELETALTTAANNGQEDTIKVIQGNYSGNFVYASSEAFNLSIEGGYTTACASRVVDASNTVLDGSNTDSVLVLSSSQIANFSVDGLTLQNGTAQTITPSGGTTGGGLNVLTNGSLALTNSTVMGSSAGSGGGIAVSPSSSWPNNVTVNLSNNTITNNSASYGGGISVYCGFDGMITLSNNTITNNDADTDSSGYGGGVALRGYYEKSTIILENNIIRNNIANNTINAYWTGGIWVSGGGFYGEANIMILTNNTISDNSAGSGSGGVFASATKFLTFTNNVISNNTADVGIDHGGGGGVYLYGEFPTTKIIVTNNTFTNNTASDDGGGLMVGLREETAVADIYNNIILNNSANVGADLFINNDIDGDFLPSTVNLYNNVFDQSSKGTYIKRPFTIDYSNLDKLDPMFVGEGDYHLKADSPCIDKGTNNAPSIPDKDFDGDQRIIDGDNAGNAIVDIGADEYVSEIKTLPAMPWIPILLLDD